MDDAQGAEPDPIIAELRRERQHRQVLVVAAVIGIVAGAACGLGAVLGAFGWASRAFGPRSPAALVFFAGPPAVSMAIGYAIYAWRRPRP
jgi:hypothetical protein